MTVSYFYAVLVFLFLPFLNLVIQISCPQNWYTSLKSALDQPLLVGANGNTDITNMYSMYSVSIVYIVYLFV